MNPYDSGQIQHRKPPLPLSQLNQYTKVEYLDELSESTEVVMICIINNSEMVMSEIGCIILSSDLREKESFSFNFSLNNPFEAQSDYICNSLNNRVWIINNNEFDIQNIISNSFKACNKVPPQPSNIINLTQTLTLQTQNNLINQTNARLGVTNMYATLQRIALNQLLSSLTSVNSINNVIPPTQAMQSVMEQTNDYNQPKMNSTEYIPPNTDTVNVNVNTKMNDIPINTNIKDLYAVNMNAQTNTVNVNVSNNNQIPLFTNTDPQTQINNINGYCHSEPINPEMESEHINPEIGQETQTQMQMEYTPQNNAEVNPTVEDKVIPSADTQEMFPKQSQSPKPEMKSEMADSDRDNQRSVSPAMDQQSQAKNFSWAAKFKTTQSPPKRRSLGVVDNSGVRQSVIRGKYKSSDAIKSGINAAINKNQNDNKRGTIIWVSYNGHQKPFIPRAIRPIAWDNRAKQKEISFFAVQHKSKSQNQQRFYLKNVVEVREKQWRISNEELKQLKQRSNQFGGGYSNEQRENRQRYKNQRPRVYGRDNNQKIQNSDK